MEGRPNAKYPRSAEEAGLRPYRGDLAFGTYLTAVSGLACVLAALGLLSDELSPSAGRVLAQRLRLVSGLGWDEVQMTAIFALGILVLSSIRLVGAIGLARGRRWGFVLSAFASGLFCLGGVLALPNPFAAAGAMYGGLVLTYCLRRLRGQNVARFA